MTEEECLNSKMEKKMHCLAENGTDQKHTSYFSFSFIYTGKDLETI